MVHKTSSFFQKARIETDFFSFRTIQIQEVFNPGATSQCTSNHTSCTVVVPMPFWVIACHFQILEVGGYVLKLYANVLRGLELVLTKQLKTIF